MKASIAQQHGIAGGSIEACEHTDQLSRADLTTYRTALTSRPANHRRTATSLHRHGPSTTQDRQHACDDTAGQSGSSIRWFCKCSAPSVGRSRCVVLVNKSSAKTQYTFSSARGSSWWPAVGTASLSTETVRVSPRLHFYAAAQSRALQR